MYDIVLDSSLSVLYTFHTHYDAKINHSKVKGLIMRETHSKIHEVLLVN